MHIAGNIRIKSKLFIKKRKKEKKSFLIIACGSQPKRRSLLLEMKINRSGNRGLDFLYKN